MKRAKKTAKKAAPKATKKPAAPKRAAAKKAVKPPAKPAAKKPTKAAARQAPGLQDFITAALDADKARDIVCIPLKGKTTIADYMVIATGTSSRHVGAMARNLRDRLSTTHKIKARVEGLDTGDWAIIDAGDVMVHLFREEVREFYDLEKLWGADFSTVNYTRYQSI
jgi:ribosome-associated protein